MGNSEKPWLRQPWENAIEHGWFAKYLGLPFPRWVGALLRDDGRAWAAAAPHVPPERIGAPRTPVGTPDGLLELAASNGWEARAAAYDRERVRIDLEAASAALDAPFDVAATRAAQARLRGVLSLRELGKHDLRSRAAEVPLDTLRNAEQSVDSSYTQLGDQIGIAPQRVEVAVKLAEEITEEKADEIRRLLLEREPKK